MKLPDVKITASQLHYGLCTVATLALIGKYVVGHAFDVGFATWLLGFWGTAVANDRANTPNPNLNVSAFTVTGVSGMVPPKVD